MSTTLNHSEAFEDFKNRIAYHDYSYMMSDSHDVYKKGAAAERELKTSIASLINDHNYSPSSLLSFALKIVPQRFNDVDERGDDLTHRCIKAFFTHYLST